VEHHNQSVILKSTVFWDITSCGPLKVNQHCGIKSPPSSGSKNKPGRVLLSTCFHPGFLLGLFFDPEDGGDMFLPNVGCFNGLHGVISQKIVLFITTAVRTSNYIVFYFKEHYLLGCNAMQSIKTTDIWEEHIASIFRVEE
jgi:hypothetical protein